MCIFGELFLAYIFARDAAQKIILEDNLVTARALAKYLETRANMETLILTERLRELCFEGKRWYDLMRYNYRHVEGVEYGKTLFQLQDEGKEFVRNNSTFLNLVTRKYSSGAAAAASKMRTEPYLYMPVCQGDIDVNDRLRQNPVYKEDDEYQKNY